jgi:hypothetical protein
MLLYAALRYTTIFWGRFGTQIRLKIKMCQFSAPKNAIKPLIKPVQLCT